MPDIVAGLSVGKGENLNCLRPLSTAENKNVINAFIQDVINQGRLERADDLVLADFVELDPSRANRREEKGC
jgi:hypothetical protein